MGKGKLAKFAEMAENPLVVECPYSALPREGEFPLRGHWHADFFHNLHPIVLELGCGRGAYTVGLGRMRPDKNSIGVDIKGDRLGLGTDLFSPTETLCEKLGEAEYRKQLEQSSDYYDREFYGQ